MCNKTYCLYTSEFYFSIQKDVQSSLTQPTRLNTDYIQIKFCLFWFTASGEAYLQIKRIHDICIFVTIFGISKYVPQYK